MYILSLKKPAMAKLKELGNGGVSNNCLIGIVSGEDIVSGIFHETANWKGLFRGLTTCQFLVARTKDNPSYTVYRDSHTTF
jgi:hypothetical protein